MGFKGFPFPIYLFVLITELSSPLQNHESAVLFAMKPKTKYYNFKFVKHEIIVTVIFQNSMKIISNKTILICIHCTRTILLQRPQTKHTRTLTFSYLFST